MITQPSQFTEEENQKLITNLNAYPKNTGKKSKNQTSGPYEGYENIGLKKQSFKEDEMKTKKDDYKKAKKQTRKLL